MAGYLVLPASDAGTAKASGRTIKVSGAITIGQLPGLFNSLLKPLNGQNPDQFSIAIEATVHYKGSRQRVRRHAEGQLQTGAVPQHQVERQQGELIAVSNSWRIHFTTPIPATA
ncbi:hypothetical protein [Candidatus Amarolinea aalborgensis]|uniref:hypothetical protein n=1 Tax=Candidatus Amarolinea aalborgensis TaxID=2249329 RepID=UPI003BF94714